ncbi:MAG: hypothetical protein ACO1RA_20590 [Planctomycetaceae bacterium]
MNRSLQAFTILIISLAGAVVSVTWSMPTAKLSQLPAKEVVARATAAEISPPVAPVAEAIAPTIKVVAEVPVIRHDWTPAISQLQSQLEGALSIVRSGEFQSQLQSWHALANRPELVAEGPMGTWIAAIDGDAAIAPVEPASAPAEEAKPDAVVLKATARTLHSLADLLHHAAQDLSRVAEQTVAKSNTGDATDSVVR